MYPAGWRDVEAALEAKGLSVTGEPNAGGMGVVVRVHVKGQDRALKVLMSADPERRERFLREAQIGTALGGHENVMRCFDDGHVTVNGNELRQRVDYILLEWLDGHDLARWLRDHKPPIAVPIALSIITQAARGLQHMHQHKPCGIVHQDVKPSNLYLVSGREELSGWVKITDFGISKDLGATIASKFTSIGRPIGTPAYRAPEQTAGREAGAQADLFSLAVVAFELFNGGAPFSEQDRARLANQEAVEPPPLPNTLAPAIAAALRKAVAPRPVDRGTIADLVNAIELQNRPAAAVTSAGGMIPPIIPRQNTTATGPRDPDETTDTPRPRLTEVSERHTSLRKRTAAVVAVLGALGLAAPWLGSDIGASWPISDVLKQIAFTLLGTGLLTLAPEIHKRPLLAVIAGLILLTVVASGHNYAQGRPFRSLVRQLSNSSGGCVAVRPFEYDTPDWTATKHLEAKLRERMRDRPDLPRLVSILSQGPTAARECKEIVQGRVLHRLPRDLSPFVGIITLRRQSAHGELEEREIFAPQNPGRRTLGYVIPELSWDSTGQHEAALGQFQYVSGETQPADTCRGSRVGPDVYFENASRNAVRRLQKKVGEATRITPVRRTVYENEVQNQFVVELVYYPSISGRTTGDLMPACDA